MEEKLNSVTTKQEGMDNQLKIVIARQYDMGSDIKAILEILKKNEILV